MISPTSAYSGATFDANVRVRPSLTLNITSSSNPVTDITFELDPASKPYDSKELNISVGTNNATGYVLTMTTANGETDLVNIADNSKVIPTLSSEAGSTPTSLANNTWGYKKDSGNYLPFASTTILSNNTRTNEDTTNLSIAAKIDYTKPSGHYEQNLSFIATPNIVTYYMQDLDPAVCTADPIEAIDLRDGNTYWVAELADGNCWMLQNLQLGNKLATTTGSMTLTPANSNVSQDWVLTNKLPSPGEFPYSTITTDDVTGNKSYIYDGNAFYCTPDGTNNYKSCYYNWYTATAGSGTSNITGKDTTGIDVNDSICPRGWVLPKGGSDTNTNNFQKLYQAMGSPSYTEMLVSPITALDNATGTYKPGFLLSGIYNSYGSSSVGERGDYWARTAYSLGHGYSLHINTTAVNTQVNSHKYNSLSVRCLRETRKIGDIENMQDISPAIVANTNPESSAVLKDTRDNNEYSVAKLKDGKVWMTQNLRLGTGANSVTITPSNSNVSTDFTLTKDADGNFPYLVISNDRSGSDAYISGNPSVSAYYCTPDGTDNYVGCYYNWYTATAGADGNEQTTPVGNGTGLGYIDVSSSICPKGWYLPSGGGTPLSGDTSDRPNSDFNMLYNNYPSANELLVSNPTVTYNNISGLPKPGFLLSGGYNIYGPVYMSDNGMYWSRTAHSRGMAYGMFVDDNSEINPQLNNNKCNGRSVRCLAY